MKQFFILLFLVGISIGQTSAQGSLVDSTLRMSLFQIQGGFDQPFGDMGDRYGTNAFVGFSYAYKSAKNILLGADFNFLFGNIVKNEDQLLRELRISNGGIVGIDGTFVNVLTLERGYTAGFYVGKIFPVLGPNPNSGIVVKAGINYLEHRTYFETRQDEYPPLEGDNLKAYDRKTAGFALYEFLGYQYFSNKRYLNFFAGFDFYQGFTTDYRTYNIDEMRRTDSDYTDFLVGFRVGIVLPVYRQVANKFYIN